MEYKNFADSLSTSDLPLRFKQFATSEKEMMTWSLIADLLQSNPPHQVDLLSSLGKGDEWLISKRQDERLMVGK